MYAKPIMKNYLSTILLLLIASCISANTYYVSTTGSDSNVGSFSKPFKTLQKGANMMKAGDTVFVRAGTYASLMYLSTAASEYNRAVFTNYPGERPILDGEYNKPSGNIGKTDPVTGNNCDSYPLIMVEGSYITFSGFEIIRSAGVGVSLANYENNSFCHHNIVENLYIHDCRNNGIWCYNASNLIIQNNDITLTANFANYARWGGPDWPSTLQAYGCTKLKILKNKVHENWGEGIGVWNDDDVLVDSNVVYDNSSGNIYLDNASNTTVSSNLIYNTGDPRFCVNNIPSDAINLADEPTLTSRGGNFNIWNNTILGCQNGIRWRDFQGGSGMKNVVIAYNTIVNPSNGVPLGVQAGAHTNVQIRNNIFVQENNYGMISIANDNLKGFTLSHNLWSKEPTALYKSANDVVADPKIAKTGLTTQGKLSRSYFELLATSPAINKGMPLASVNIDMYKNIRDAKPDVGAFEFRFLADLKGEEKTYKSILLYPNLAQNEFYVVGEVSVNSKYEIISIDGKTLQAGDLSSHSISIGNLKTGLYLIKIKIDAGETVQRFVKE